MYQLSLIIYVQNNNCNRIFNIYLDIKRCYYAVHAEFDRVCVGRGEGVVKGMGVGDRLT
jgi:hypothetical protein